MYLWLPRSLRASLRGATQTPSPLNSSISAWYRYAASPQSGGVWTSVVDVLNTNPADASTSTKRAAVATSSNGFPTALFDGTDDNLVVPLIAANNGSPRWGVAFHLKNTGVAAGVKGIWCVEQGVGANLVRIEVLRSAATLIIDVYVTNDSTSRRATYAGVLTTSTVFLTIEYDGDQTLEADKCVVTLDAAVQTAAFSDSNGTPGPMPATLRAATGSGALGTRDVTTNLGPLNATIGPNIYFLQAQLTAAQRTILSNFERPT